MNKWILIHGDRFWKTSKLINLDNILLIRLYLPIGRIEITYRCNYLIFPAIRHYYIVEKKDSEYNYFKNLGKKL